MLNPLSSFWICSHFIRKWFFDHEPPIRLDAVDYDMRIDACTGMVEENYAWAMLHSEKVYVCFNVIELFSLHSKGNNFPPLLW